ncbi:hypothetical protein JQ594_15470 [Bradyrhizobium manausense]|uniref:DNA primase family protein n=1 Tax=Bradyrhizobium manausense TaxID=989370 RepID=UPI001BA9AC35|nr:phage/plasmid primase, P4 family [Bradyrhizobium manausense]MBR0687330.1 hypothetical protein [Bradyrhizobium manausense]
MTGEAVLAIIDAAPAFVDVDAAALAQAIRKFGLEQLEAARGKLRSAAGDDRKPRLVAIAEQLGELVGAGALEEAFAKAVLEQEAADIGLLREIGAKAVKGAIAGALKAGKKHPRDMTEVRRAASSAALGAPHDNGRPPSAGDSMIPSPALASPPSSPSGDADDSDQTLASSSPFASDPPAPSAGAEGKAKTLANEEESDDEGDNGAPPSEEISTETFRYCAGLDQSDVDNGKRLLAYFGRDILVRQEDDVPAGQLLAWTGTHWDLAGGAALAQLIGQKVGDLIKREAGYIELTPSEARIVAAGDAAAKELKEIDPDADSTEDQEKIERLTEMVKAAKKARAGLSSRRSKRRQWGVSSKNSGRVANMIKEAAPHLRRHADAFNADALKVATLTHTLHFVPAMDEENPEPDGTRVLVDRDSGRVQYRLEAKLGHDRDDMLTAVIPFAYNKRAKCPEFDAFLDLFQPEPDKRRTVQQFSGLSLTAQPLQRIMFHTGTGGNGKSVFLEVIARVLGDGLAVGVPAESVSGQVQNNPSAPTPDIARCYAKRFIRIAELPKDAPLKGETIKKLTGGERWPVRTMYKGYFEFKPTAKPHMSGNGEPKFDGADGGLRRRLLFVEWAVQLAEEKHRDFDEVVSEIVAGGSGILNWLIAGCLDFLNNGFFIAADVAKRTADTFSEMDPCQQFIDACVKPDPGGAGVTSRAMFDGFNAWREANGIAKMYETRFGLTMKKKLQRDDSKRVHVYVDVALHDLPASPHQSHGPPDSGVADEPF